MKKMFILCLVTFSLLGLQAETGIKVGLSGSGFGTYEGSYMTYLGFEGNPFYLTSTSLLRPTVGLFKSFELRRGVAIQAEMHYIVKGMCYYREGPEVIERTWEISYLEIPLFFKYTFGKGRIQPGFLAGPYAAIRLNGRLKRIDGGSEETVNLNNVKTLDLGVSIGLFSHFRIGGRRFSIEARADFGLSNAMNPLEGCILTSDQAGDGRIINQAVSFLIAYTF